MVGPRDPPYPELKKTHTMARQGRPWTDHKPPSSAPVWAAIEGLGRYYVLLAAIELDVFDTLQRVGAARIEQLSAEIGAPVDHLRSLLDAVVALGLLDQFDHLDHLDHLGHGPHAAMIDGAVIATIRLPNNSRASAAAWKPTLPKP